jgi:hypothetical protein
MGPPGGRPTGPVQGCCTAQKAPYASKRSLTYRLATTNYGAPTPMRLTYLC